MNPAEQAVWTAVYAAVINGYVALNNPNMDWSRIRDRALIEANEAVRRLW